MSVTDESTQPSAPAEFSFAPGQRVGAGRFRLERLIGRGGMGTVWLALDERLKEPVALKFLSQRIRDNSMALDSMRKETSRSHSLSHQHIVRVHDLYESAGEPAFISMEFVDGKNLHDLGRTRPHQAFGADEVARWMRQLCAALGYAHSRGVIHRDLKPANLMLDNAGELKLADFGLAAALRDPTNAEDLGISGTPAYMSPQQFAGAPASVTDDIYSLGACLFELLTGMPVFAGPNFRQQIEFEPAPQLSATLRRKGIPTEIPEAFEDLLDQCLSKNPANRPQTAAEFLRKANAALAGDADEGAAVPPVKRIPVRMICLVSALVVTVILSVASLGPRKMARGPILNLKSAPVQGSSFVPPSKPELAFDGLHRVFSQREGTRWAANMRGSAGEWVAVDLGRDMRIDSLTIDWELAYAKDFEVRTRTEAEGFVDDPKQWKRHGKVAGFLETIPGRVNEPENQEDVVFDFARGRVRMGNWMHAKGTAVEKQPVVARHVMVLVTAVGLNNREIISIYEIEIAAKPLP